MDRLRAWQGILGLSLLGATLVVGSSGCGEKAGGPSDTAKPAAVGGKPRIVLVTNSNSDYWSAAEKGMKRGGREAGR